MRLSRAAASVLAAFGLTVGLSAQAGSSAPIRTTERQHIHGGITVEPENARQTRIQFYLNTPTYLAYRVVLEAGSFTIRQEANGGVRIESAGTVRVTGFTLARGIDNVETLQYAPGNVLTWDQGFNLRIHADGTPEWRCCPRKE